MTTFFNRYFILTREERLLVAGIILIALCGLGVRYFKQSKPGEPPVVPSIFPDSSHDG